MIILFYTFIFAAFLNACNGVGVGGGCFRGGCFGGFGPDDDFDIDDLHYQGDPIKFVCVSRADQTDFDIADVAWQIPAPFINSLKNGRGLSLLFSGITNMANSTHDSLFQFVKEWSEKSGTNVCVLFYAYLSQDNSSQVPKYHRIVNKMVNTQRFEYVAKMARDLVLDVGLDLVRVDLVGFCFGAHIAGRCAHYLTKIRRNQVRLLLLLDPLKVSAYVPKIKKWEADYVQVIHTSQKIGIWDQIGNIDIYVQYEKQKHLNDTLNDLHGLAFLLHMVTSTKRNYIWAREKGIGSVWTRDGRELDDECLIGVYSVPKEKHLGMKLKLHLKKDNVKRFWQGVGLIGTALGSYQVEEIRDDICCTCMENKVDVTLGCSCTHPSMCMRCWKAWRDTPNCHNKCPVCKQTATKVEKLSNR